MAETKKITDAETVDITQVQPQVDIQVYTAEIERLTKLVDFKQKQLDKLMALYNNLFEQYLLEE